MNAAEVERMARAEWERAAGGTNPHGLSLDRNLAVPAYNRQFKNSFYKKDGGAAFQRRRTLGLWVVGDEMPGKTDGYLIVFDDARGSFGLATKTGTFIAYYGSPGRHDRRHVAIRLMPSASAVHSVTIPTTTALDECRISASFASRWTSAGGLRAPSGARRPERDSNPCTRDENPVSWAGLDDGDQLNLGPGT